MRKGWGRAGKDVKYALHPFFYDLIVTGVVKNDPKKWGSGWVLTVLTVHCYIANLNFFRTLLQEVRLTTREEK